MRCSRPKEEDDDGIRSEKTDFGSPSLHPPINRGQHGSAVRCVLVILFLIALLDDPSGAK